jgi:formylglycine-generating enzyme required for sulfatase activity
MRIQTNQIPRVIPFLAAILMFTACSKKPVNVSGQIFVVTSGRENVKMGLVGVHVISDEQLKVVAAKVGTQIKEATIKDAQHQADQKAGEALIQHLLSLESPELKVPQLEALRKEAAEPMAQGMMDEMFEGNSLRVDKVSARADGNNLSEVIFNEAKDRLFTLLPTIITKTDADGRFTIPVQSKVWVIASGERAVADKKEHYLWMLPYALPENAPPAPLLIANDSEIDSLDQFYALLAAQTGPPPNLSEFRKIEVRPEWAKWIETAKEKAAVAVNEAKAAKEKADAEAEKARVEAPRIVQIKRDEVWKQSCGSRVGEERVFEIAQGVKLTMCWIPAGEFVMGSSKQSDATPHPVKLTQGFWLSQTEVTQAQWRAVMDNNPSNFIGDDLPVESVSWNDICGNEARTCGFLGMLNRLQPDGGRFDLPTEAQWEYACRAGNTGDDDGYLIAWYDNNSDSKTHPVGQKQANAWGLNDMQGNVGEWCIDGHENYPTSAATDPTGLASGSYRIVRGGGWNNPDNNCRVANRNYYNPSNSYYNIGFRVVRSSVP